MTKVLITRYCRRHKRTTKHEATLDGFGIAKKFVCLSCKRAGLRTPPMTARQRRVRAAIRAWHRRQSPTGGKFTTAQRDLLLKVGYLAPIVTPLPRRRA